MQFLKNIESKIKHNFNIWDFALLKSIGLVFGLLVGAFYTDFIIQNYIIFISALALIGLRIVYKLFSKK